MPSVRRAEPILAMNQLLKSMFKKPRQTRHRSKNSRSTNSQRKAANRIEKHMREELNQEGKNAFNTAKTKRTYEQMKRLEILKKIKNKGTRVSRQTAKGVAI
jgi:hypothetical protein